MYSFFPLLLWPTHNPCLLLTTPLHSDLLYTFVLTQSLLHSAPPKYAVLDPPVLLGHRVVLVCCTLFPSSPLYCILATFYSTVIHYSVCLDIHCSDQRVITVGTVRLYSTRLPPHWSTSKYVWRKREIEFRTALSCQIRTCFGVYAWTPCLDSEIMEWIIICHF